MLSGYITGASVDPSIHHDDHIIINFIHFRVLVITDSVDSRLHVHGNGKATASNKRKEKPDDLLHMANSICCQTNL